jgi:hypothetical protein
MDEATVPPEILQHIADCSAGLAGGLEALGDQHGGRERRGQRADLERTKRSGRRKRGERSLRREGFEVALNLRALCRATRACLRVPRSYGPIGLQILGRGCAQGSLQRARSALRLFALRPQDVLGGGFRPLLRACANGHLAVGQWLAGKYLPAGADGSHPLSERQTSKIVHACARAAITHGHCAVVFWLAERFGLQARHLCAERAFWLLSEVCGEGRLGTAKRLVEHCSLRRLAVHGNWTPALYKACTHGHLDVADWLTETFDVRGIEPNVILRQRLTLFAIYYSPRLDRHNTEALQWLSSRGWNGPWGSS